MKLTSRSVAVPHARQAAMCRARENPLRSVSFTIPVPPSTNNLFANASGNKKVRVKTADYIAWIEAAFLMIVAQKVPAPSPGPFRILVKVYGGEGFNTNRDIDNCIKPCVDLCKTAGLIQDDNIRFVVEAGAIYLGRVGGKPATCTVEITTIGDTKDEEQLRAAIDVYDVTVKCLVAQCQFSGVDWSLFKSQVEAARAAYLEVTGEESFCPKVLEADE